MSAGDRLYRDRAVAGGRDGGSEQALAATASMQMVWRKSSWSAYNGNCVEVASLRGGLIAVRDSKDAGCGPTLVFGSDAWGALVGALKKGSLPS